MDEAKTKGTTGSEAIILEVAANAASLVASDWTVASSGSEAESSSSKKRSRPKKEAGGESPKKRRRSRKEKSKDVSMETKINITKAAEPEPIVSAENSNSRSSSVEQSLQEVDKVHWKKCDSTLENGRPYFYNASTGTITWEEISSSIHPSEMRKTCMYVNFEPPKENNSGASFFATSQFISTDSKLIIKRVSFHEDVKPGTENCIDDNKDQVEEDFNPVLSASTQAPKAPPKKTYSACNVLCRTTLFLCIISSVFFFVLEKNTALKKKLFSNVWKIESSKEKIGSGFSFLFHENISVFDDKKKFDSRLNENIIQSVGSSTKEYNIEDECIIPLPSSSYQENEVLINVDDVRDFQTLKGHQDGGRSQDEESLTQGPFDADPSQDHASTTQDVDYIQEQQQSVVSYHINSNGISSKENTNTIDVITTPIQQLDHKDLSQEKSMKECSMKCLFTFSFLNKNNPVCQGCSRKRYFDWAEAIDAM